jgi:hypothetical protein
MVETGQAYVGMRRGVMKNEPCELLLLKYNNIKRYNNRMNSRDALGLICATPTIAATAQ